MSERPDRPQPVLRRGRAVPPDPRRLIVATTEELLEAFSQLVGTLVRTTGVTVVLCSELADPREDADFLLDRYVPSAPAREYLFQSASLSLYEQDPDGVVYRNGTRLNGGQLVAFGQPDAGVEGSLAVGRCAALLFDDTFSTFMSVSTPIVFLVREPLVAGAAAPSGWLSLASGMAWGPLRPEVN